MTWRPTYFQFRALLFAKQKGDAGLFYSYTRGRTLHSLAQRGFIEWGPPWSLTPEGGAAIDRATGRNQPVRLRAYAQSHAMH